MSRMADSSKDRRPRRRFTDEIKQQAVRLVLEEGKSVNAVARELDLAAPAQGLLGQAGAGRSLEGAHRPDDHRARSWCGSAKRFRSRKKSGHGSSRSRAGEVAFIAPIVAVPAPLAGVYLSSTKPDLSQERSRP